MKNKTILTRLLAFSVMALLAVPSYGQAFHKGSFLVNLSEGWTFSKYTTNDLSSNAEVGRIHAVGDRDPLAIEYGISSRWGIGLSTGYDIFQLNPSSMYSFTTQVNQVKATTSDFTIDCSYHFFITDKSDLSFVVSMGGSSVNLKGNDNDYNYQYIAKGGIVRLGMHARFFVCKHLGFLAMLSTYRSTDDPRGVCGNTVGNNYSTTVNGTSLELGLCYRFKK